MTEVSSLTVEFGADTTGLARGIRDVDGQLSNAQRSIGQRMQSIGGGIRNVGMTFAGLGGPITAINALAVRSFSSWESAFAGVIKTVDGTDEELAALSDTLRSMATDSANPLAGLENSAVTLASIGEMAGQLGVGIEDIAGFTQVIGELTLATDLTAESASMMIAQFANVTGMDLGEDLRGFGNALVALGNNSATTESAIMAMAHRLSGIGKVFGIGETDILGISAAMSSAGIQAESGGSAMTRILNTMGTAVDTHNTDFEEFARVAGMTQEVFERTWDQSPVTALVAFLEGFKRLEGGDQAAALENLGLQGLRTSDTIRRLSANTEQLVDSVNLASEAVDGSALGEEATKRFETFESQVNLTKNKINDLGIIVGGTLAPVLEDLNVKLGGVVDSFALWAEENPETIRLIAGIAAAITAVGVVAIPVGLAISALGTIFAAIASPIAVVIGLGVALGYGIFKLGEALGVDWSSVMEGMVDAFKWAFEEIGEFIQGAIDLFHEFDRIANEIAGNPQGVEREIDTVAYRAWVQMGGPGGKSVAEDPQALLDWYNRMGGDEWNMRVNPGATEYIQQHGGVLPPDYGSGGVNQGIVPLPGVGMGAQPQVRSINLYNPVFEGVSDANALFDELGEIEKLRG